MKRPALVAIALTVAACEAKDAPAPAASAASSAVASASAPTVEPTAAALPAIALARKKTPSARLAELRASCESGDANACWSAALRYLPRLEIQVGSPARRTAGCGVERSKERSPRLKVGFEDVEPDTEWARYFLEKACANGDKAACSARPFSIPVDRAHAGLLAFFDATDATRAKMIRDLERGDTSPIFKLYERDKGVKPRAEMPESIKSAAIEGCKRTGDCDEILMMLDKNRYATELVTPVREAAAEVLVDRCLEGDCGCGEAALDLPAKDTRRLDLARLGCDDGEAEGCYALGLAYEEGWGVDRNLVTALRWYEAACPAVARTDVGEERSRRACDRLAAAYDAGDLVPKNGKRALFYARQACRSPGYEPYHGPCVRLSNLLSAVNSMGIGTNDPGYCANGPDGAPIFGDECTRPSVADVCAKTTR